MLGGIDRTLSKVKEALNVQPNDLTLKQISQVLQTLVEVGRSDQTKGNLINQFCDKLEFGAASNTVVLEKLNEFVKQFRSERVGPKPRRFIPSYQAQQVIEMSPSLSDEIYNFCKIFENESRVGDSDRIFSLINDLQSKENANKAPMPRLTRCAIQGGGAKGAAYAGTYEAMDALGVTDTTKTYCGASAGAITSFSMGLGYNSAQFKAISSSMNFQDLADYNPSMLGAKMGGTGISQATSAITQLHVHSGVAFHNWAKSQCALVFDDPDITFVEMKEWYEQRGMPAPEMIFMGSMVSPESKKVIFSAAETPHIRIADAVRASMSFPIAWEQFDVRYGKSISRDNTKIRDGDVHGRYADGGILNNYPIDVLNSAPENPAYNKPISEDAAGARSPQNPSSYGFSLTSSLKEFDENKTPMTNRLHILKQRSHGRKSGDEDFERRTAESKLHSNKFGNLMSVLKMNFLGDISTSEQDHRKREIFVRQTSLIYTEGVTTLEFNLTPYKKKLIEDSGKFAFINWYIKYRNPNQTYDDFYHSKNIGQGEPYDAKRFEGDSALSKEDLKKLDSLGYKDKQASVLQKYCRLMIDIYDEFSMLRKVLDLKQDPEVMEALSEAQKKRLEQFSDLSSNQRLKHLSWQISELKNKYAFLKSDQALKINKTVLNVIRNRAAQLNEFKSIREQQLDQNITKEGIIAKINSLLQHNSPEDTKLAIAIFKGQMSKMFDLMMLDPNLLSNLALNCNNSQLQDLLHNLRTTAHQLDQQGRLWNGGVGVFRKLENETLENFPVRFSMFLEKFARPSLLEIAILQGDQGKIDYLLEHKSAKSIIRGEMLYINPLSTNLEGKNSLHTCVDTNNFVTFSKILSEIGSFNLPFDANGQHLLHYAIENGNLEFISQLFNDPNTVKWIQTIINTHSKSNPEFCSRFGCGESLRQQIIRVAATKDLVLDFDKINNVLKLKSLINTDVVKLYDSSIDSADNKKDEQYLEAFLMKNVEPSNIPDFGSVQALRCLTLPYSNGKILMELAAADNSEGKKYTELALKLIDICHKDPVVKAKLNELYKVKFKDEKSLLYLAIEHYNPRFFEVCLANGSNIDLAGPFHTSLSALTLAAELGRFDFIEKMIGSNTAYSRSISDSKGRNVLHYLAMNPNSPPELYFNIAAKQAYLTAGQYLKVDLPDMDGKTPFDFLIENKRFDIIDRIVSQKSKQTWYVDNYFDVFNIRGDGKTSLQNLVEKAAVDPSYKPFLKLILNNMSEAGLYAQDANGKTVLHYLAESNKDIVSPAEFSDYLVKGSKSIIPTLSYQTSSTYQALTNTQDNNANSVLRSIINSNRFDIIEYLNKTWKGWYLNAIFDLQSVRSDGLSDYEYFLQKVNPQQFPELFTNINSSLPPGMQRDDNGQTALHHLIDEPGSASKVWDLLTKGLKTWSPTGFRESSQDYKSQTSLLSASNQTLLRHIIVANRPDILQQLAEKTGSSLVGMATTSARWYLDDYFDMTLTDENGISDLEFASKHASKELKNILFSRLSPNCLTHEMANNDSRGWTPLHYVANDIQIDAKAFWENINRGQVKGDPKVYHERTNIEDINGDTPFRLLIANNRIDVIKELATHCTSISGWKLDHYINMNVKRPDGMNDLEYLVFKAKNEPALTEFLKTVENHTSSKAFKEASASVDKNHEQFARQVAELEERRAAQAILEPASPNVQLKRKNAVNK